MAQVFKIKRFVTPTGAWTPIVVQPGAFSRIVIENEDLNNATAFRIDQNDSDTQKGIPAGMELDIDTRGSGSTPFNGGDIIGYMNPAAGNGPAVVTFTR